MISPMLFAIVGTTDRDNFVFDRWPRSKQIPKIKNGIKAGDLSQKLTQYFYYFGLFRKNAVLETTEASFSQTCLIQIFNANEKRIEVVLGIDDQCVLVSRSAFIVNNEKSFGKASAVAPAPSNLFSFEDVDQQRKDIVNSITLLWKAESFNQVSEIKNKLSYLIGILRFMEQSENFLSKQISKIGQAKDLFDKKLKQKCAQLNKDTNILIQQFKAKQIFQQMYDFSQQLLRQIQIFKQMSKFYCSCVTGSEYTVGSRPWQGSVCGDYKIPNLSSQKAQTHTIYIDCNKTQEDKTFKEENQSILPNYFHEQILSKTTLTVEKKITSLPRSFRDQRVSKLYNIALKINDASLQTLLDSPKCFYPTMNKNSVLQTIEFIKQNEIGLNVYPFDARKYYNLYCLKKIPEWSLIKKFNTKIFKQDGNLLKQVHPFSKFKRVSSLDQKLKYIILQGLVKQVNVYIYYLECLRCEYEYESGSPRRVRQYRQDDVSFGSSSKIYQKDDEDDDSELGTVNYKPVIPENQSSSNLDRESSNGNGKIDWLTNYVNKPINLNQIKKKEPEFSMQQILKAVIDKMDMKRSSDKEAEKEEERNKIINRSQMQLGGAGRAKLANQSLNFNINGPPDQKVNGRSRSGIKETDPLTLPKWGFYYVQKQ